MPSRKELEYEISDNGCWLVTSHKPNKDGYPQLRRNGKLTKAHKFMYESVKGEIPEGFVVRHTCDNPTCCNPEHLILGSQLDNIKDRVERNRSAVGTNNGNVRLTEEDVRHIRQSELSTGKLAKAYSMDAKSIWNIRNYKTWKHVV